MYDIVHTLNNKEIEDGIVHLSATIYYTGLQEDYDLENFNNWLYYALIPQNETPDVVSSVDMFNKTRLNDLYKDQSFKIDIPICLELGKKIYNDNQLAVCLY